MSLWLIFSLIFWLGGTFLLASLDYDILKNHNQVTSYNITLVIIDALFWPLRIAAILVFAIIAAVIITLATFTEVIKTLIAVVFIRK